MGKELQGLKDYPKAKIHLKATLKIIPNFKTQSHDDIYRY